MEPTATVPKKNDSKVALIALGVVVLIAIGAITYINLLSKKDMANIQSQQTNEPVVENTAPSPEIASPYADGAYTSVGNYTSPGGPEEVEVTVTIEGGIVVDTSVKPLATRPISIDHQNLFVENYKPLVMGKAIDQVQLDKVSGSSLTSQGFNDALEKIKEQAQG